MKGSGTHSSSLAPIRLQPESGAARSPGWTVPPNGGSDGRKVCLHLRIRRRDQSGTPGGVAINRQSNNVPLLERQYAFESLCIAALIPRFEPAEPPEGKMAAPAENVAEQRSGAEGQDVCCVSDTSKRPRPAWNSFRGKGKSRARRRTLSLGQTLISAARRTARSMAITTDETDRKLGLIFRDPAHASAPATHVLIVGVGAYASPKLGAVTSPPISARALATWFLDGALERNQLGFPEPCAPPG